MGTEAKDTKKPQEGPWAPLTGGSSVTSTPPTRTEELPVPHTAGAGGRGGGVPGDRGHGGGVPGDRGPRASSPSTLPLSPAHLPPGAADSNRSPRRAQPMGAPLSAVPAAARASRALIGRWTDAKSQWRARRCSAPPSGSLRRSAPPLGERFFSPAQQLQDTRKGQWC